MFCFQYKDAQGKQTDPIAVRNASYASGAEVCQYISALGISKVQWYII